MSNALLSSKNVIVEEPPRIRSVTALPTAVLGMVGVTQRGPLGVARRVTSFEDFVNLYGNATPDSLDAWASAQGFFEEGGQFLSFVRTAHYTNITDAGTVTAVTGTVTADTNAATAALLAGVNAAPYALEPGDDVSIDVDGGGPATATIAATQSSSLSANSAPFALTNGNTLLVAVDGGPAQTVTFNTADFVSIGAATAPEVIAVLNAQLLGVSVTDSTGAVLVTSDTRGTNSLVNITGGTDAAAFGFPGPVAGTGNVADVTAVSFAELKALVEAAVTGLTVVEQTPGSGIPDLVSNTTGASSTLEITASTNLQTAVGWPAGPVAGSPGVAVSTLQIDGKTPGAYANTVVARIKDSTSGEADRFDLDVLQDTFVVESFQNLTMDDADASYVETVINGANGSDLIAATDLDAPDPGRPANGDYALGGGDDGLVGLSDSDFIGSSVSDTGIRALDTEGDLTLLTVPGRATSAVHNAMIQYGEVTRSLAVFSIIDPPAALNTAGIIEYVETTAGLRDTSEHGIVYWPRVKIINPNKTVFGPDDNITVPNSGIVAGRMARLDQSQPGGVYVAPAGIENGNLRTITGLEDDPDGGEVHQVLKEANRDLVYPKLINPISNQGGALNLDGTRTLKSNGNFPGVAERRGVIFIEQTLKEGLQFARHKNHTEALRGEVERTITEFLINQMRVGAFRTNDPATAFFVDVSEGLNPPSVVFANQLIARVGLATNKTVDWVILRFTQDTRAQEQELAQLG
jgi:hypothetical protein